MASLSNATSETESEKQHDTTSIWSSKPVVYSKETQELLKVMMQEAKLSNMQQQQLRRAVKGGESLPINCILRDDKPIKQEPRPKKLVKSLARPGLRLRAQIEESGAYTREKFVPDTNIKSLEKEKTKLQNVMAYGQEELPEFERVRPEPVEQPYVDRFDELIEEVNERRSFLTEMENLGLGKNYRALINTEISQKVAEMEKIDKERRKGKLQSPSKQAS